MWTSGCRNCNLTLAERTFFCRLFFDFFLCVFQFFCKSVHNFHHNEYNQSHDQEINDCRNEFAIIQCNFSQKIHFQLIKIHSSEQSKNWIDDTILVNAPPIMIPTAMSMTLPRLINSLNSFMNFFIVSFILSSFVSHFIIQQSILFFHLIILIYLYTYKFAFNEQIRSRIIFNSFSVHV